MDNSSPSPEYLSADRQRAPLATLTGLEAVVEAMWQRIEDGSVHARPPLALGAVEPFSGFLEIGIALRECLQHPERRELLIERLRPHCELIHVALPASIQQYGLVPEETRAIQQQAGFRSLEHISDDELTQWLSAEGGLIYGELKAYELENYLSIIAPMVRPDSTMIDLGSGLGKVVLTTALLLPFKRCIGVEVLDYRHRLAVEKMRAMLEAGKQTASQLPHPIPQEQTVALPFGARVSAEHVLNIDQRISMIEADMFQFDVSDASLIFIYSTCFGSFMEALANKLARECQPHCLVSTTTYQLQHPAFKLVQSFPANTLCWTTVFLYERLAENPPESTLAPKYAYQRDRAEWEAKVRMIFTEVDAQRAASAQTV